MLKKFASYYKPHMKMFILDMIAAFIVSVADLFYPRIAQNIINDYVPNKNLRMLLIWSGALLLIYLIKMLLNFFMQYQGHMVGIGIQSDMRKEAFKRLQKLPLPTSTRTRPAPSSPGSSTTPLRLPSSPTTDRRTSSSRSSP